MLAKSICSMPARPSALTQQHMTMVLQQSAGEGTCVYSAVLSMVGLGSSGTTSRLQRVSMNRRRVTSALCVATLQRRRASCGTQQLQVSMQRNTSTKGCMCTLIFAAGHADSAVSLRCTPPPLLKMSCVHHQHTIAHAKQVRTSSSSTTSWTVCLNTLMSSSRHRFTTCTTMWHQRRLHHVNLTGMAQVPNVQQRCMPARHVSIEDAHRTSHKM